MSPPSPATPRRRARGRSPGWAGAPLPLVLLLAGCPSGGPSDAGPPPDACLGLVARLEIRTPKATYKPLDENPEADLLLGFQGFKMIFGRVHANRPSPVRNGAIVLELEGGSPWSQSFPEYAPRSDGQGGELSEEMPIFFNSDPLPKLVGRKCSLTLRLGTAACNATSGGRVLLVYNESCIQDPSGGITCRDGGM